MHKAKNVEQVISQSFLNTISKCLNMWNILLEERKSIKWWKVIMLRSVGKKRISRVQQIILIYCHQRHKVNKWEDTIFMLKCAVNMTEHHKKCSDMIHLKLVQINTLLVENV